MLPSASALDLSVWPAHLPPGARWLPYNAEPAREPAPFLPPALPVPVPGPGRRLPIPFWRFLLVVVIVAGFVGILGGFAARLILGVH